MSEPTEATEAPAATTMPTPRSVIEYVGEEYTVTALDVAKYFLPGLPSDAALDTAERVLLACGIVRDADGTWSLPTEHLGDPDGALTAWAAAHGNDALDLPVVVPTVAQAPKKAASRKRPPPRVEEQKPAPEAAPAQVGDEQPQSEWHAAESGWTAAPVTAVEAVLIRRIDELEARLAALESGLRRPRQHVRTTRPAATIGGYPPKSNTAVWWLVNRPSGVTIKMAESVIGAAPGYLQSTAKPRAAKLPPDFVPDQAELDALNAKLAALRA